INELKISGEISQSKDDISRVSRDASIFKVTPKVVLYPKDAEDVKSVVKWAAEQKQKDTSISITARSAGTDMGGGPLNDSMILDFTKHFNRVLEVGENYAITEPGVYYRDFEPETLKKGLLMPSYPASRELCTVGGMVSNNSGGEKSLRYGKTERYVRELHMVLSDGNEYVFGPLTREQLEQKKSQQDFEGAVYRGMHELLETNYDAIKKAKPDVSKNSAGYYLWNVYDKEKDIFDLNKLLVGSQGTLGMVTKIKFDLIRPKKHSKLLVIFLKDLKPLGDLVNEVMRFKPESFESYDDQTLKLAIRFLPAMLKKMKGNVFSLFFKFMPEMGMVLSGGMPKLVLIAEFTADDESEIDRTMAEAEKSVKEKFHLKTHLTRSAEEAEKYWTIRRESFSLLRSNVGDEHTAPFIDDIIVHVNQLPTFLPKLNELVAQYKGLTYTIAGHAGDANFHVIPLMDFRKKENREAIPKLSEQVYDLVISLHGSITAEHNDGLIRTPYLEKMYGSEITDLFRKTKEIFDPHYLFNPRKKVPLPDTKSELQYDQQHTITE
ncbi:MAG TPA: FAD-binding oxidoreductase, partial [Candidatus Paceibacterota bacterium]|nr:FAD-binding oxidoreductase [Candidatus Paceibacterota bacterium]